MNNSEEMAQRLLEIGAVNLNSQEPFTWTSGIQSPVYCDNRQILGYYNIRAVVKTFMAEILQKNFPKAQAIAGVATEGISFGTSLADYANLPFCYVRPEPKKHGLSKQIEGVIPKGKKVVVVEGLISTGKSSLAAVKALQDAGCKVIGVIAIFTYGFSDATEKFMKEDIPFHTITDFQTLSRVAVEINKLKPAELKPVLEFAQSPYTWQNNAEIMKAKQEAPSASQTLAKDDFNTGI